MSTSAFGRQGSVEFFVNDPGSSNYDYADQTNIPLGFGEGEFTLELWIRPNDSFPIGTIVDGGVSQTQNWAIEDVEPYSRYNWWWTGNFLLDGHNNSSNEEGTFSLQFYGGGRVRWLFGDGSFSIPSGGVWSIGAYPASNSPSLLDGGWHQLTLVRRWQGQSDAQLELWVDGEIAGTETSDVRTDMRQWWTSWPGFPSNEEGWFWGTEKQAAIGRLDQYEDYKGLIDELRFWSRAKSPAEISAGFSNALTGNEQGLVGRYSFDEAQGIDVCDAIDPMRCMVLRNSYAGVWSPQEAPMTGGGADTQAPTRPMNLQGNAVTPSQIDLTWDASTDDLGVAGYEVRRDGSPVQSVAATTYSDFGLQASTTYTYSVAAFDAAGNVSQTSTPVNVTTPDSADSEAPSRPENLQGSAVSDRQIEISWSPSTDNVGVSGYDIFRDGLSIGSATATSYSDGGLEPNTSYVYSVAAQDAAGNASPQSNSVSITTQPAPAPATPPAQTSSGGGGVSIFGAIFLFFTFLARLSKSTLARMHALIVTSPPDMRKA